MSSSGAAVRAKLKASAYGKPADISRTIRFLDQPRALAI